MRHDFILPNSVFYLREYERALAAHFASVTFHDLQIRPDRG